MRNDRLRRTRWSDIPVILCLVGGMLSGCGESRDISDPASFVLEGKILEDGSSQPIVDAEILFDGTFVGKSLFNGAYGFPISPIIADEPTTGILTVRAEQFGEKQFQIPDEAHRKSPTSKRYVLNVSLVRIP